MKSEGLRRDALLYRVYCLITHRGYQRAYRTTILDDAST
ncbi:hypothetical protein BSU04_22385 [Caballeronia sordidicola]|uniref:Uncharacterized protein n=1 Tax=Caballeronia sordidicola TaxID=196367 RepID=A0A226X0K6_CABSO|nr:hypothetical protein BSU04_22385 [Caballeronia sordidicola]